jgi:hypothetical protein
MLKCVNIFLTAHRTPHPGLDGVFGSIVIFKKSALLKSVIFKKVAVSLVAFHFVVMAVVKIAVVFVV